MSDKEEQNKETEIETEEPVITGEKAAKISDNAVPRKKSKKKFAFAIATVLVIVVTAIGLWRYKQGQSNEGRAVPAPRNVIFNQSNDNNAESSLSEATITIAPEQVARTGIKVETVGEQLLNSNETTLATGVVQSNAYRETPVVSLVGGIVRKINLELGQKVKRGQTVAIVFSEELSTTQSLYLKSLAELEEFQKRHQRTMKLIEIGAVSREELEQTESKLKTAESEVASLRQKLLLLGLSPKNVDDLNSTKQVSLEFAVPSPASGTITSRKVNQGEVIDANEELLRVTDLSSVWVIGQVYEKDLAKIRVGSGATITTDAYTGRVFRGQISYVDPQLDTATRTAQVRVEFVNPREELKIGMYVNIAFATITGAENTIPVVPTSAVQNINNQQVVFIATNNPNVFALRQVRVGAETNGRYAILEGLNVGDRIVTEGSFLLRAEWLKLHPSGINF